MASPGQNCAVGNDNPKVVPLSPVEGVIEIGPAGGEPAGKALATVDTKPTEQTTDAIAAATQAIFR